MNSDLQAKARKLYFQTDLSKTDIANALGMPRRTLHHWIKEKNWEYQKQSTAHMPVLIAEHCYHILANYTEQLLAPERKDVMISLKEVNTIHKLTITINKLKDRATLNENMEVLSTFVDAVDGRSPEMAQAISPYINDFIDSRAAASKSVPRHFAIPLSPEEIEKERQLDSEYDLDEEITHTGNTSSIARPSVSFGTEREETIRHRRTHPSYKDLLADLRRQDENIRHLFPVVTGFLAAA
jgi:hypothetical protein